jgi:DNA-binding response OmpR family regulator
VIVLSAQAGDEQRAAGLEQGADDYLVKPFSTRELLARVEALAAACAARVWIRRSGTTRRRSRPGAYVMARLSQ